MSTATIPSVPVYATPVPAARVVRLRITRRGRIVLFLLTAAIAVGIAAGIVLAAGSAEASSDVGSTSFDYVQVGSGESLWDVATSIAPDADPRDVVAEIMTLNLLESPDLQPGQRLAVPAAYSG